MAKTTSAERMRRMREKAQEIAWSAERDEGLSEISLSGLLELLSAEARKCHGDNTRGRAMCAGFMQELGRRLEITVEASYSRGRY